MSVPVRPCNHGQCVSQGNLILASCGYGVNEEMMKAPWEVMTFKVEYCTRLFIPALQGDCVAIGFFVIAGFSEKSLEM